ncbi:nitronate monooxygenase [Haliea salexigens]|jgi:NAD(P)H-dependent flavin oxidoreductase YrpB (nitropropane dioxygenase family)|uniref:nitronate monooxygenase n=1 Tax=Haliea salexigens TaxID=287487 RepID=UPI00041A9E16|nr:nitronate monooxygenase family protein [Haliea salexigens]|tara:strand:+ start:50574 stop:51698 length:1125 start_codon:yes stop_codon:yes gene_type:complete
MKTPATELLNIELPIFAFSHCRDVVAAVSKAGGMGVLGISAFTPEQLEEELAWIDAHVDGNSYGVDILIPNRYDQAASQQMTLDKVRARVPTAHREFSDALCAKAGAAPLTAEGEAQLADHIGKIHMTPETAEELVAVALRHPQVSLLVNALGTPPRERVAELHARGLKVGSLIGKVEHAAAQVEAGVDLIVAQGSEAGGHTGRISSMILWPQVIGTVSPVPVLAAGGIGSGRQMAAAMAMGAAGIWCGSIWLGTAESELSTAMKARLFEARSDDAIQSRCRTGKPCRMLRSKFTEAWDSADAPPALPMPMQTMAVAESLMRIERAHADDYLTYPVGQLVGDMQHETSVRQVIQDMLADFIDASEQLNKLLASA